MVPAALTFLALIAVAAIYLIYTMTMNRMKGKDELDGLFRLSPGRIALMSVLLFLLVLLFWLLKNKL